MSNPTTLQPCETNLRKINVPGSPRFLDLHAPGHLFPDWYHDILIVGTFNPYYNLIKNAPAPCFYGHTQNNYFWDLLPEIFTGKKLRSNPSEWIPFLQKNQIGLTDLILDIHHTNQQSQELLKTSTNVSPALTQIEWNTNAIIKKIQENRLSAVFIINTKAPTLIENEITKIKAAAARNSVHFDRLVSSSTSARFQIRKGTRLYPTLFARWFETFKPAIQLRLL